MTDRICVELQVSGKVQGVGYRAFVRSQATRHGVSGWAVNCRDGHVKVRLCGMPVAVNEVEKALQQGPKWSLVECVQRQEIGCENLQGFTVG